LKPILDTDFEFLLKSLKTEIDTKTESGIEKNKQQYSKPKTKSIKKL